MPAIETEIRSNGLSSNIKTSSSVLSNIKFIALISTLGGLLFGYDSGMINGAMVYMQQDFSLTPLTEGMVTSFLLLGAAVGSILCGRFSDAYGRRKTIMFLSTLFFLGALACVFMPNATSMIVARFFLGIAVGGASVTVPTYLAEVAPTERRGQIVTRNELMIVFGITLAYVFNSIIGRLWGESNPGVWRWMFAIATLPAIALFIGMFFVPESPRWLVSKGKSREAWRVLKTIREKQQVRPELDMMEDNVRVEKGALSVWHHLSIPWVRRTFILGIGVAVIQQATGVNAIMYYGTQILTTSGFGRETALVANVLNGVTAIISCLWGIHLLGKMGRKTMFVVGLAGTTISLMMIAAMSAWLPASEWRAYAILASMVCFLVFIQGMIGPVTWVLLSEIFPISIRGFAFGFSGFMLWTTNFLIGLTFPSLVASIGVALTFMIFACCTGLGMLFILRYLPETRGKSLEEIEAHFQK
ncbi:TPA: sugar porter family MFS transporter [Klebsiella pneumoniae]|nr:sugar porter family MFS transporter [Klebsiella pneumoniae]